MAGELIAGIGLLKTAFDMAKALKDIDDRTRLNSAVIDLQQIILDAQTAQAGLLQKVGALEAEMTGLKTWDAEKQKYELKDIGNGAVAYMLKSSARNSEPLHWLCPNCYAAGKKAFYQPTGGTVQRTPVYRCQSCHGTISVENSSEGRFRRFLSPSRFLFAATHFHFLVRLWFHSDKSAHQALGGFNFVIFLWGLPSRHRRSARRLKANSLHRAIHARNTVAGDLAAPRKKLLQASLNHLGADYLAALSGGLTSEHIF